MTSSDDHVAALCEVLLGWTSPLLVNRRPSKRIASHAHYRAPIAMWPAKTQLGATCRKLLTRSGTCDATSTAAAGAAAPAAATTSASAGKGCCCLTTACRGGLKSCSTRCRWRRPRCKSLWSACTKSFLVLVNFTFLVSFNWWQRHFVFVSWHLFRSTWKPAWTTL